MTIELPKYHETFLNILDVLSTKEVFSYSVMLNTVRDKFYSDLPDELLKQTTKNGYQLICNRIGWGKAYLHKAKMLHLPQRGMVQITEKGLAVLEKGHLSLYELKKDKDFIASGFAKNQGGKKSNNKNISPVGSIKDEAVENSSPQDLIERGISIIDDLTKDELLERFKKLDPYYFEKVILILLEKMGYGDFIETKKSGDGGIDGIINQDQLGLEKIFIQAKRYSENKIREKDIRNFIGAMSGDTTKGVFVTTSEFDESAIQKAKDAHRTIVLIDGQKLSSLMYQFGVGVQTKNVYEVKEIDEDFFDSV